MNELRLAFTNFPSIESAREIATSLIQLQLASCVNLIPNVVSIYSWNHEIVTDAEVTAIFKTSSDLWPAFMQKLQELHPYEVPEILALNPTEVFPPYLSWALDYLKPNQS